MKKERVVLLKNLKRDNHAQPFRGPFTITRVQPGDILGNKAADTAFGPLAIIDHAVVKKGLTIKIDVHINDEISSYIRTGVTHYKDSVGFEAPIVKGELKMMNAGGNFWHEEKVKGDEVEICLSDCGHLSPIYFSKYLKINRVISAYQWKLLYLFFSKYNIDSQLEG